MTLSEFIIRIKLSGGQAAAELRKIMRESDKARKALDGVGKAADRADKRLNRPRRVRPGARRTTGVVGTALRAIRVGGGVSVGGSVIGATGNLGQVLAGLGRLGPAGIAAATAVGLLAVGAVIAAKALNAFQKQQDVEAAIALTVNPLNKDGSKRTPKEMDAEHKRILATAESKVVRNVEDVNGRMVNVFAHVGKLDRLKAAEALAKNEIEVTNDSMSAYLALGAFAEGASEVDKARALEAAKANIMSRGGDVGKELMGEAARMLALASATALDPREAIRMIPKGTMVARLQEWDAAAQTGFLVHAKQFGGAGSSGKQISQWVNTFMSNIVKPSKLALAEMDKVKFTGKDAEGKVLGPAQLFGELARVKAQATPEQWNTFAEKLFGASRSMIEGMLNNKEMLADSITQMEAANVDFALLKQAQTITAAETRLGSAIDDLLASMGGGSAAESYASSLNAVSSFIEGISTWVTTNRELIDALTSEIQSKSFFISPIAAVVRGFSKSGGAPVSNAEKAADPQAKTVAEAKVRAEDAAQVQRRVIDQASQIDSIAASAQQRVAMFQPLLSSAQQFATAMPLWVRAARFGVQSELLQTLAMVNGLAGQFAAAGNNIGVSLGNGIKTGASSVKISLSVNGAPVGAPVTPYTRDNRQ